MTSIKTMLDRHKPMDEMDKSEKDTVSLSCLMGFVAGFVIASAIAMCIVTIILVAVSQ